MERANIKDYNFLQNKFHRILELYLYGGFYTKVSKILFPIIKKLDFSDIFDDYFNSLLPQNLKLSNKKLFECPASASEWICEMYKYLELHKPKTVQRDKEIACKWSYDQKLYEATKESKIVIKLVNFLKREGIENYVDMFGIHGSFSTHDYVQGMSDLDLIIILNDLTLNDPKKLETLHRIIYESQHFNIQIDRYQHHGPFALTPLDLDYYPETYFPLILFNYTTQIFGKKTYKFSIRNEEAEKEKILLNTLNIIESYDINKKINSYEFKIFFQTLQLLPISFLQYKGVHCYKRDSFNEFARFFPNSDSYFSQCYKIRHLWKEDKLINNKFSDTLFYILKNPNLIYILNRLLYGNEVPDNVRNKFNQTMKMDSLKKDLAFIRKEIDEI